MLRAFSRRSKNIAEGPRLALIRSEAIWSVHRMHKYCGQIWILDAGEHRCDGSPHTRLYGRNQPERQRPLEVAALVHDLAGRFGITCQRRRDDHMPSLLKFRPTLIMMSVALDRQHRVYPEIRQYVALQEPAKFAATTNDEYRAWIVRHWIPDV